MFCATQGVDDWISKVEVFPRKLTFSLWEAPDDIDCCSWLWLSRRSLNYKNVMLKIFSLLFSFVIKFIKKCLLTGISDYLAYQEEWSFLRDLVFGLLGDPFLTLMGETWWLHLLHKLRVIEQGTTASRSWRKISRHSRNFEKNWKWLMMHKDVNP